MSAVESKPATFLINRTENIDGLFLERGAHNKGFGRIWQVISFGLLFAFGLYERGTSEH